jgi:hypothetical protein
MLENPSQKFKFVRKIARFCLWLVLAYFTVLMARITLGYWPVRNDAAFLQF